MINLEAIKKSRGFVYTFCAHPVVDGEFVKTLRSKLKLSQTMFAMLMHVKKKTVEKWEQGKNPISNGNAVAMILFDKHPELVADFIKIEIPENISMEYSLDLEKQPKSVLKNENTFIDNYREQGNSAFSWKLALGYDR